MKKLKKKIDFVIFISKNPNFLSVLAQFLKNLSRQSRIFVTLREMTDNLLTTGHF